MILLLTQTFHLTSLLLYQVLKDTVGCDVLCFCKVNTPQKLLQKRHYKKNYFFINRIFPLHDIALHKYACASWKQSINLH